MMRPFDNVPVNERRERVTPIIDGIPVGQIRSRLLERTGQVFCGCENPKPREARTMFIRQNDKVIECRVCAKCWYPIKPNAPSL